MLMPVIPQECWTLRRPAQGNYMTDYSPGDAVQLVPQLGGNGVKMSKVFNQGGLVREANTIKIDANLI